MNMGTFAKKFEQEAQSYSKKQLSKTSLSHIQKGLAQNLMNYRVKGVGVASDKRLFELQDLLEKQITDLTSDQLRTLEQVAEIVTSKKILNEDIKETFIEENAFYMYTLRLAVGRELETKHRELSDVSRRAAIDTPREFRKNLDSLIRKEELNREVKGILAESLRAIHGIRENKRTPSEHATICLTNLKETLEHTSKNENSEGGKPDIAELATKVLENWSDDVDYLTSQTAKNLNEYDEEKHVTSQNYAEEEEEEEEEERVAIQNLYSKLGLS